MISKVKFIIYYCQNHKILEILKFLTRCIRNRIQNYPQTIGIMLSSKCNLNCIQCSLHKYYPPVSMSIDLIEKIKDYKNIIFDFGITSEPLINENIFEIMDYMKRKGAIVHFTTNATLMNDKAAQKMVDLKVDHVDFSIDSCISELFNRIRKGANFDDVIDNIKNLNIYKTRSNSELPALSVCFVAMKSNYATLPDTMKLTSELGIHRLIVNNVEPYNEQMADESLLLQEDLHKDVMQIFDKAETLAKEINMDLLLPHLSADKPYCPFINPMITPEGEVVPCSVLSYDRPVFIYVENGNLLYKEKWLNRVSFGNINDMPFSTIYKSEKYKNFRKNVTNNNFPLECDNCLLKYNIICPIR